jgi:hypothetical protein
VAALVILNFQQACLGCSASWDVEFQVVVSIVPGQSRNK